MGKILKQILLCVVALMIGVNCQLFAETRELSTYAHIASIESRSKDSTQVTHSHAHKTRHQHSHKHRHSKNEPEHEHTHSHGAVFGSPSVSDVFLSSNYSEFLDFHSHRIAFPVRHQSPSEGFRSTNFRPPIV
jgi:hypothetical protein